MHRPVKMLAAVVGTAALAGAVAACGTSDIQVSKSRPASYRGAELFQERCSGCHSLTAAASNGSASNVRTRLRTNGPNFNVRKESAVRVKFAIENGGFSGAIMPQNIVVGSDADLVAAFVAKYAGQDVKAPIGPAPATTTQPPAPQAPAAPAPTTPAPAPAAQAPPPPRTTAPTKPSAPSQAAAGAAVFTSAGCGACHTFAPAGSKGQVGPNLTTIGKKGKAFIRTSIVKPGAVITKGYPPNVMPATFGQSLSKQQIDQLVAYLLSGSK